MRRYAISWAFVTMAGRGLATAPDYYQRASSDAASSREPSAAGALATTMSASAREVSTVTRKIIYDGNMQLAVENFLGIPAKVDRLVATYGAIVADPSVAAAPGDRRSGRWNLRVLTDLTDLATLTLSIQEIRGHKLPQVPTFGTRVPRAWQDSLQGLLTVG